MSIYQLGAKPFPPLKTISNTNLPRPASSLVGRERELSQVLAKFERGTRLLTLTGPGGSGKTRLAVEAAATLVPFYKAGVFFVGSRTSPGIACHGADRAGARREGRARRAHRRSGDAPPPRRPGAGDRGRARACQGLCRRARDLTLFCTSRELLRVQGEVEYADPHSPPRSRSPSSASAPASTPQTDHRGLRPARRPSTRGRAAPQPARRRSLRHSSSTAYPTASTC